MSNLKRKDAPGENPAAKVTKKAKGGAAQDNEAPVKAPAVSLLKDEEPLFPRGGANVLTPLEQKQIQLEAKADAVREEQAATTGKATKTKKSKKSATKSKKGDDLKVANDSIKIESLSFKKLVKGSLVLGEITRIYKLGLEVSLPNNLTGHVSIVAVSEQLTDRLQHNADDSDDEENGDDDDDKEDEDVDLKSIFAVGQFVRASVLSTTDSTAVDGKSRRKIELSLRPAEANSGLNKDDVVANGMLVASVTSVEDHGLIMDVGIDGQRAFLSMGEIDSGMDRKRLQPGASFLCQVKTGGKVAQLTLKHEQLGNVSNVPNDATTINTFVPGTAVSLLVTGNDKRGLSGKIIGSVDATADLIHSGVGPDGTDLEAKYKIGSRVKARVICNFPTAKAPKLGLSLLPHITNLSRKRSKKSLPTEVIPIASVLEKCTVRTVETAIGLFVDTGVQGLSGFVHISRVKDGKVDALYESSGPYQVGTSHKGRVVGYSQMDGLFHISFEKSILEQQYIRLEDVPIGANVEGRIEKLLINEEGVSALVIKLAEGITGLVSERHFSDVRLQHPEKKFREGMKVNARVLSVNLIKKQMRLTLKKTLVNSELPAVSSYDELKENMQIVGTIVKVSQKGAHMQFYGTLKGFLPISEMSEAYISDPNELFKIGQVVSVHVLDADGERNRLVVSCKDPSAFGLEKQNALKALSVGHSVSAKVVQKNDHHVSLELIPSLLQATLPVGHLTDKSTSKNNYALKRVNAGQTLSNLVIIEKNERSRSITVSQKPSLLEASKNGKLISSFAQAKEGKVYPSFVHKITATAVIVRFGGVFQALLPKARLSAEAQGQPDFGMQKNDSVEVRVVARIPDMERIIVAPASAPVEEKKPSGKGAAPADGLEQGSTTTVKVTSIKETQLNVQVDGSTVQGRIDVSQIYDNWGDIEDPKKPLAKFQRKQALEVKVMGIHDAKDHRFLPISHRSAHSVLELTVKPSDLKASKSTPISFESLKVGDTHIAYVNNVSPQFMWVNLSPQVRGRITAMEASDDLSQLNDLEANFPVGSALKVRVTAVDADNSRLDLTARSKTSGDVISWDNLKTNMVLPGKVTKVNERQILVKLSESVSGPVHLPDMADDFADVDTTQYKKNDIVRVSIVHLDTPNKKLRLSLRPSRILSSSLPVEDKEIVEVSQLSSGDVVRGFVKNVSDKGLFVLLGGQVTALVKIGNLSDRFLKEWKDQFQVDQLVKGRIISIDAATGNVDMSLKASVVDEDYTPPITISDIKKGQIITGKVRKVEDFGAFILVDNSANVSGLCHRSQMAEKAVQDATKLYKEGDVVKAIVLEVDTKKKRISFGLKPSFFEDADTDMEDSDAGAALDDDSDEDMDMDQQAAILKLLAAQGEDDEDDDDAEEDEDEGDDDDEEDEEMEDAAEGGLGGGKKAAWSADPFADSDAEEEEENDNKTAEKPKKKKSKNEIQVDRTADLDTNGPQTASDYERLLLGQPDSSELWIAYMAFQMQVSDLGKAREVAERAIKSINIREETEKLNVWVAFLNLEVAYGTKASVEEVFNRACQYNDPQEIYERLTSIYIQSGKTKDSEKMFDEMLKKFGAVSPKVWENYAHFLHVTLAEPARARALLPRAVQRLGQKHGQQRTHDTVSYFAALEFQSPNGEPERGRTMFEGLLAAVPKRGDLWDRLLKLEQKVDDAVAVRDVFERRTRIKSLKPKQAEKWFRLWADWEGAKDPKGKTKVMAKAQDWAAAYKARQEAKAAAADEDEEMDE